MTQERTFKGGNKQQLINFRIERAEKWLETQKIGRDKNTLEVIRDILWTLNHHKNNVNKRMKEIK